VYPNSGRNVRYYYGMKAKRRAIAFWVVILMLVGQAATLWYFGQPFFCECGEIKVWEGDVSSSGNSQQLADWYTFSHVIHGILFFWFLSIFARRIPVVYRLLIALGIEVAWEVVENTPWLINHYRQQALAAGYSGDSIFNSLSDSLAMIIGFIIAWRVPVLFSIAFVIIAELYVGSMIRDGLMLNIVNLIYPFEFIREWQMGG
jgi:Protein of unknown function (DUF2585)